MESKLNIFYPKDPVKSAEILHGPRTSDDWNNKVTQNREEKTLMFAVLSRYLVADCLPFLAIYTEDENRMVLLPDSIYGYGWGSLDGLLRREKVEQSSSGLADFLIKQLATPRLHKSPFNHLNPVTSVVDCTNGDTFCEQAYTIVGNRGTAVKRISLAEY